MDMTLVIDHNGHVENEVKPVSVKIDLKSSEPWEAEVSGGTVRFSVKRTHIKIPNVRFHNKDGDTIYASLDRLKASVIGVCVPKFKTNVPKGGEPIKARLVSCILCEAQPNGRKISYGLPIRYE